MKVYKILLLVICTVGIMGCTQKPKSESFSNSKNTTTTNGSDVVNDSNLDAKNQEFTLTGKLSKSGNLYLITDSSGKIQDLESYTVEFDSYLGKTITVTGEFSGDTLFVTEIE